MNLTDTTSTNEPVIINDTVITDNNQKLDLPIKWLTDTGVKLTIDTVWDWIVFGDVWVNREYRLALQPQPNRIARILDIGANVGYFSLLAAHECRRLQQRYQIIAIEGNPYTFETLKERVAHDENISCLNFLAGKRLGQDYITLSANHGTSAVVAPTDPKPKQKSNYINFDIAVPGKIDLLKCDIEGSEHDLVREFPDLLRRTQVAYFELHYLDEIQELYDRMTEYGFTSHQVLMNHGGTRTEVFGRAS